MSAGVHSSDKFGRNCWTGTKALCCPVKPMRGTWLEYRKLAFERAWGKYEEVT